jgi:hypothetical protein
MRMLYFFKHSIKYADDHNSFSSKSIRWSAVVKIHTYECDFAPENLRPVKKKGKPNRRKFESAADAIFHDRKKVQKELREVYLRMLPDLEKHQLSRMSIVELEALQDKLIDKLDRLRIRVPDIEYSNDFNIFCALERKLILVIDAWQCKTQRVHVEDLLDSAKDLTPLQHIDRARSVNLENKEKPNRCFPFIFSKEHDIRPFSAESKVKVLS